MPTEYTKSYLVASLAAAGDSQRPYWGGRDNIKITDRLVFSCALPKPGKWNFTHFYLRYRKILLIWALREPVVVTVVESAPPPISVRFPGLMTPSMKAKIAIDLRQVSAPKMRFRFAFVQKVAVIPAQAGTAKLIRDGVERIVEFGLERLGNLQLTETLAFCQVELEPVFELVDREAERATLEIVTTFDTVTFSSQFELNTRFPIKVEGRLISDDIIHLSVMNMSDIGVFISNEETEECELGGHETTYLLHDRSVDRFVLVVREEGGQMVTPQWIIDERIMVRRVKANIEEIGELYIGGSFAMDIELPAGSYALEMTSDFVFCGIVERPSFDGGIVSLQMIPNHAGVLMMPAVVVNGIKYQMNPSFVEVAAESLLSSGPFLTAEPQCG
jgi:hypothetical protein